MELNKNSKLFIECYVSKHNMVEISNQLIVFHENKLFTGFHSICGVVSDVSSLNKTIQLSSLKPYCVCAVMHCNCQNSFVKRQTKTRLVGLYYCGLVVSVVRCPYHILFFLKDRHTHT